jgi:cyclophilin family peptidyl-prolyl cis-trans isomerase
MSGGIRVLMGALMLVLAGPALAQTGAAPVSKPAVKPVPAPASGAATSPADASGPTIVVETSKGTFEITTFPDTAPKTVAHITALAKRGFYNGQRVHRMIPGFVVQFGDPLSKDMGQREMWGTGDSGKPIGVAEMSKVHRHDKKGMVAIAHGGNVAKTGDSQMYITLAPQPQLDADYPVFGEVTSGLDVVEKLQVLDVVKRVSVK